MHHKMWLLKIWSASKNLEPVLKNRLSENVPSREPALPFSQHMLSVIKEHVSFSCVTVCAANAASRCGRALCLLGIKHGSAWRKNEIIAISKAVGIVMVATTGCLSWYGSCSCNGKGAVSLMLYKLNCITFCLNLIVSSYSHLFVINFNEFVLCILFFF